MNIKDIKNAVKYLQLKFKCDICKHKFNHEDIFLLATADHEGLFELRCPKCKTTIMMTIVNVFKEQQYRFQQRIIKSKSKGERLTKDDILDVKNFLDKKFDGNFKKLFDKKNA